MQSLDSLKELIKQKHSNDERRYIHSLGVAKMAEYLAIQNGVDPKKAIIAGYLHDFCKNDDIEYVNSLPDAQEAMHDIISERISNEGIGRSSEADKYINNGKKQNHIADVCNGKRKTAYGYKWIYKERRVE